MSDLQTLVAEVTQELEDEGFLKKALRRQMEKGLEETAQNLFRSYGTFGKALEKKVESELVLNLDKLSVASYGDMLLFQLRAAIDETVLATAGVKIQKLIVKYLTKLEKTEWKLSEIIAQWKKDLRDYRLPSESDQIGFSCEESEYTPGAYNIGFDEDPALSSTYGSSRCKSQHQMKYQLSLRADGTIADFTIDGKTPLRLASPEGVDVYGFSAFMLALYANQATILVDEDEVVLDWNEDND